MAQKDLASLITEFQGCDLCKSFGPSILENMSSKKDNGAVFPPYVPFLGDRFRECGILVYGTAQNVPMESSGMRTRYGENFGKLSERLYYSTDFETHYQDGVFGVGNVPVAPFQSFVVPALIALYAKAKKRPEKDIGPDEILDYCGVTNYYKFSLNSGKRDVNPDYGMGKFPKEERVAYWALNDALVERELKVVQPRVVLSFRGRKLKKLNELSKALGYKLFAINDPAWILRGGSGKLKPGASWHNEYDRLDDSVRNLIDSYIGHLQDSYVCKAEGVKAYLAHYYNVFEN